MKCTKCGHINKQDSLFCENCGTRLNEEKPVGKQSSNAWKWVAIVSIILFVITLSVNIGDSPSSSSNEQRLRDRISQLERKNSGLQSSLNSENRKVGKLERELYNCQQNSGSNNDASYKKQIQSLNQQIDNLNSTIQQKNKTINSKDKTIKEKDKTIKELKNRIEVLNSLL